MNTKSIDALKLVSSGMERTSQNKINGGDINIKLFGWRVGRIRSKWDLDVKISVYYKP